MGENSAEGIKKLDAKVMKKHGEASETGATTGSTAVSRKHKAASATLPETITFYRTAEGVLLGNF